MKSSTRITVSGTQPYDVVIGSGVLDELTALLTGVTRVAIVHQPVVGAVAARLAILAQAAGATAVLIEVPDGEAAKTIEVAAACWERFGAEGFTRNDAVVGVGGGAVTDLAGWVAAAWLRGIALIQVPTTLAGMVDAAVGGKTAVNTSAGKNLVGAFHPPRGVLCELTTLAGLPETDYRAGLAEVVKCGFIADPVILDLIEAAPAAAARPGSAVERELVERSVRVKAAVVGDDLTEQGRREILNYGHTLAHAIESIESYRWRHGDAVSVGLVFAATLARRLGRLDPVTANRHKRVLDSLGLPTSYDPNAFDALLPRMRVDKKARGATIRFVILDALACPTSIDILDEAELVAAYREMNQ